ncbi:MAG: PD-(D/E)XK nuclease family protein [Myxococcales bacterium]|nr:PD-(D/E)XK nuclease family protein [Myxococcales bacterium]
MPHLRTSTTTAATSPKSASATSPATRMPVSTPARYQVRARSGASSTKPRRVEGVLDLLLETPEGVVVIDHKSYPGAPSTWEKKALEHPPQLAADAHALRMVEGVTVRGCFVHFALGGGMVELRARDPQRGPSLVRAAHGHVRG